MLLSLTSLDENRRVREFFCHLERLEVGFELLNSIVASGDILVKVSIMDKGRIIDLPTEAFDGVSSAAVMEQLEQEWNAVLSSPPPPPDTVDNQDIM